LSKKKTPTPRKLAALKPGSPAVPGDLLIDLRSLIEGAREATARAVNSALVLLYWSVGDRIRRDILKEKRAGYGEQIVPTLSALLAPDYGSGFSKRNLFRMIQFAELVPDRRIVSALLAIPDGAETRAASGDNPKRANRSVPLRPYAFRRRSILRPDCRTRAASLREC
jgi:hypothetical protein